MLKFVLNCLILFIFLGCGAKKLIVANADFLLEREITKRLPLNDHQKMKLHSEITTFLNEHKPYVQKKLPDLKKIELNLKDLEKNLTLLQSTYQDLAKDFNHLLARHLAHLNKEQVSQMMETLRKENKNIEEKVKKKSNKAAKNFKKIFGEISPQQEKILKDHKAFFTEQSSNRLTKRKKLQADLEVLFEKKSQDPALYEKAFMNIYGEKLDHTGWKNFLAALIPTLTETQKKNFNLKKFEIIDILELYLQHKY
jgi:hypothetical protein